MKSSGSHKKSDSMTPGWFGSKENKYSMYNENHELVARDKRQGSNRSSINKDSNKTTSQRDNQSSKRTSEMKQTQP